MTVTQSSDATPAAALQESPRPDPGSPQETDVLLRRARRLAAPALRAAVDALPEQTRALASYHFGWTDLAGNPDSASWGKGVRTAFTLACARAVGGNELSAVPAAAAVELVHNASLIHDDLLDADTMRRHRPAVWAASGTAAAVLVGDALFHAGVRALHTEPGEHTTAATMVLLDAVLELIDGEKADTAFETRHDVTLDECLTMVEAKTGALLGAACALGARYGGIADPDRLDAFARFGRHVGLAYQAVDDYLGIWGVTEGTGKPVLADLVRRKKSLPVVYALNTATPAAAELAELYFGDGDLSPGHVDRAAELVEQTGAREWVREFSRRHTATAREYLACARPAPGGLADLFSLIRLVSERDA
ncbi:polyprenyl synthetase family protein [Nocardia carnea]|uniref:polyprenyl synthetase family protein n=1 Tax=Nocardia carnea TaxID=37328 RepID=UPI002458B879|nr:polyprenyl synthetase family protein [Nocardia carnea]